MGGRLTRAALLLATLMLLGCSGGTPGTLLSSTPIEPPQQDGGGFQLEMLRGTSGAPAGVRISWTRVDDAAVSGYYIYRDTDTIPDGDPAGHESLRVNGGDIITQSGSGNQTLTFDDAFSPSFGDTYYYRLTVANQTDRSEEHTSELQSPRQIVCRLPLA